MVTVNHLPDASISGPATVCAGGIIAATFATPGGIWSGSNIAIDGSGNVIAVAAGVATITYVVTGGSCVASGMLVVTVNPMPDAGIITGIASICPGGTTTLSDVISGGIWSSASGIVSVDGSGHVTGVAFGTGTVSYTVSNAGCSSSTTKIVTVNPSPAAGTIIGVRTVCEGGTTALSDAVTGGFWSTTESSISLGITSGVVSGISAGTAIVTYGVSNSCGTAYATTVVTVSPLPGAGTISGLTSLCVGGITTLSDGIAGGLWTTASSTVSVGTSSGIVTGISAGTATVTYNVTNSCGTATATKILTVNPLPVAGTITGIATVCTGGSTNLTDAVAGGAWTSGNTAVATVGTDGSVVSVGSGSGTVTISYTVTNSCGTATATRVVTINATGATAISGTSTICLGTSITLSDAAIGGTWNSGNPGVATVSAGGVVTGVALGTATISYTVAGSCGCGVATTVVTVNNIVTAGTITGASTVCIGMTNNLTDDVGGGTWTSSNVLKATVNASGVFTGLLAGTVTIYYSVANACGTATTNVVLTINATPAAGTISGTAAVCIGSGTTLSDVVSGGTWLSLAPAIATVSAAGLVSGIAAGTALISYTVANSCGTTAAAVRIVTVSIAPDTGAISGAVAMCGGATISLTDGVAGGVWSSSTPLVATVSGAGVVSGLAIGTTTISYSVTNACGTAAATAIISVLSSSAGTISGPSTVVIGGNITLTDAVSGGTWSASNGNATVSGGIVTGVAAGTVTISYTVGSSCGDAVATKVISVGFAAPLSAISGYYFYLCTGATAAFWDASSGGSWSITPASVATISPTGVVTGIGAGTATISYTYGFSTVTNTVTVYASPAAISGPSAICSGTTASLADATAGGTWSSSVASVATISTAGVVTGSTVGNTII